jgi:CubicO group peptidase (beta-lactamase class C family)
MSALCIALLVERRLLSYDDLVVKYWPEYGQNGKENTTIEDVLTHKVSIKLKEVGEQDEQAGLPCLEGVIGIEEARETELILRLLEKSRPVWAPGSASGYHAVTFGWLVDGIVRHVDPRRRDIATFFRDEIAVPYGRSRLGGN